MSEPDAVPEGEWRLQTGSGDGADDHPRERRRRVGDLAHTDFMLSPDTITDVVAEIMLREPTRDAVALGRDGVPCGLITRQTLLTRLSHLYGNALYRKKAVSEIADLQPLMVNGALPPEEAARRATARPHETRYNPLIVTVGGSYHGLVSVSALLDHLNGEAVRRARLSNALSGLPAALLLEAEVQERIAAGRPLAFILADLDNFKPYNDHYGLARGDTVLMAMAQSGQQVVAELGGKEDIFGHIGGDDFVILTTPDRATVICETVSARFDAMAARFYDLVDTANGGIVAEDRDGRRRFFPLISVSVIAVNDDEVTPRNYTALTEESSRRKVAAKRRKQRSVA